MLFILVPRGTHQLWAGCQTLWEPATKLPEHSLHFHSLWRMQFLPAAGLERFHDAEMTAQPGTVVAVSAHSHLLPGSLE